MHLRCLKAFCCPSQKRIRRKFRLKLTRKNKISYGYGLMTSWANYRVYGRVGFAVKVDDVGRRLVSLASDKMRPTSFGTVSTETTEKR